MRHSSSKTMGAKCHLHVRGPLQLAHVDAGLPKGLYTPATKIFSSTTREKHTVSPVLWRVACTHAQRCFSHLCLCCICAKACLGLLGICCVRVSRGKPAGRHHA